MSIHPFFAILLDPGMGKTAICLEDYRRKRNAFEVERALVVAPLKTCYNVWPNEAKKWRAFRDLDIRVAHGTGKTVDNVNAAHITVINPEGLKWLIENSKKILPFHSLYVDESTLFKNPSSQRSRALFKLAHKINGGIPFRYLLTGTPAPNGVQDLFGQFKILEPSILGDTLQKFRGDFCFSGRKTHWGFEWEPTKRSVELIEQAIAPHSIRLAAEDHLDMPDKVLTERKVSLPPDVRKLYDELEKELFIFLDNGEIVASNAGVLTGKCRQIANGAVYLSPDGEASITPTRRVEYLHQEKAKALIELYEELGRKPLLVAYEFGHDLTTIKQCIKKEYGFTPRYIGETTRNEDDQKLIEQWNNKELPLLLINPAGASHGLNLQAGGHHICWYSLTWNLEHYIQLNDRLYRQGQPEGVFIHHLIAERTADEKVWKVLQRKDATQLKLMNALKEIR